MWASPLLELTGPEELLCSGFQGSRYSIAVASLVWIFGTLFGLWGRRDMCSDMVVLVTFWMILHAGTHHLIIWPEFFTVVHMHWCIWHITCIQFHYHWDPCGAVCLKKTFQNMCFEFTMWYLNSFQNSNLQYLSISDVILRSQSGGRDVLNSLRGMLLGLGVMGWVLYHPARETLTVRGLNWRHRNQARYSYEDCRLLNQKQNQPNRHTMS